MIFPEGIIVILIFLGIVLLSVRMVIGILSINKKPKVRRKYETGASKTIGSREIQEDEYGIIETEEGIMAVLADGMGGNLGGKIAARTVVQVFEDIFEDGNTFYKPQYSLKKAFQRSNREILNLLDENQGHACVAAVMINNRRLYYATVGNVKIAVYRNRELVPVTSGHTIGVLARQKYEEGKLTRQEAVSLLENHRLYNYVGQDGFKDIEFFDIPIALYGGEYVVLMSDGLYEAAVWKDMEACLEEKGSCQEKAFRIIELVNRSQKEEKDNASVVILGIG